MMISENNLSDSRQAIEPGQANNVLHFDPTVAWRRKTTTELPDGPAEVVTLEGTPYYPPQTLAAVVITDLAHRVLTSGADHKLAKPVTLDPELHALLAERLLEAEMTPDGSTSPNADLTDAERHALTMVADYGPDQADNVFMLNGDMFVDTAAAPAMLAAPVADTRTPAERSADLRQAMQKLADDMRTELEDLREFQTVLGELKQEVSRLAISTADMRRAFGRAAGRSSQ